MQRRSYHLFATSVLASALLVASCAGGDDVATSSVDASYAAEEAAPEMASDSDSASYDSMMSGKADNINPVDTSMLNRDLIVEMGVSIETNDVQQAVSAIRALVTSSGGIITNSDIGLRSSVDTQGWATIIARIEPARLDGFLLGLDDAERIGTLTATHSWTQDVTEQLVELDVRIDNQRESVETIRRLLAQAVDLSDVVMLESELNSRQTELEVLLAQQASLSGRVAMSTVTIDLYSPGDSPVTTGERSVLTGFSDGWSSFVGAAGSLGWLLAAASPYLAVIIIVVLIGLTIRRRRNSTTLPTQRNADRASTVDPSNGESPH